jgi:PAS domain S-box-containing protein
MKVAHRLMLLMLLATIPAMVARIFVLDSIATTYLRAAAAEKLSLTARSLAAKVDYWNTDTVRDLQFLSHDTDLVGMDSARQRIFLRRINDAYPQFTLIHTLNISGMDTARSDNHPLFDYQDHPFFRQVIAGAPLAREIVVTEGRPFLTQAVPLVGPGAKLNGVLALDIDLRGLNDLVSASPFGQTGYSCLVDQQGRTLAHPDLRQLGGLNALSSPSSVRAILKQDESQGCRHKDATGKWWLAHAAPVTNGWSVISFQQESEVLAEANRFIVKMAVVIMVVTACLIAAISWFASRWITRPIAQITRAAGLIARGDWKQRISEGRRDELGTLARAFNTMVADLVRAHDSMAEKAQKLSESEQNYRRLIETCNEGVWIVDADEHTSFVNAAMCDMLGYSAEELLGQHPATFMAPDQHFHVLGEVGTHKSGVRDSHEFCFVRKDGSHLWVLVSASPVHNPDGADAGILGMFTDITQRRRAEKARHELQRSTEQSLALLETLQSHAPVGFAFIDRQFRYERINETLAAINGRPASAHFGHTVAEVVPSLWPQAEPLFHRVLAGDSIIDIEISGETPSLPGELRHWLVSYYPVRVDGEGIIGIGIVCVEITERKRSEASAREQELSAHRDAIRAMENILGIVGHELRTPLAGMRAISEFLLTDGSADTAEGSEFLRQLNAETIRMSETVNDLLEAARLNSGRASWRWSKVDLNLVCREAIETVRPLVDSDSVEFTLQVSAVDTSMMGDFDAIRRLIINLLSNARKHTQRGRITVVVSRHERAAESWVHIEVRDTGTGIPPKILDRLGEAFALNAGVIGANHVEGAGLGLAICKGIAAAHGGLLTVASTVGSGAQITARLRADLSEPATGAATLQLIDKSSVFHPGVPA